MTRTRVARAGMVAALAVVMNHALAAIPNIELTSLTLFVGGALLGPVVAAATGAAAALALSLANPMGMPGLPMLLVQMIGYATWCEAGSRIALDAGGKVRPGWAMAASGLVLTLWFQLLLNGTIQLTSGLAAELVWVPAIPFVFVHATWNTVAFGFTVPVLLERLAAFGMAGPVLLGRDPAKGGEAGKA